MEIDFDLYENANTHYISFNVTDYLNIVVLNQKKAPDVFSLEDHPGFFKLPGLRGRSIPR